MKRLSNNRRIPPLLVTTHLLLPFAFAAGLICLPAAHFGLGFSLMGLILFQLLLLSVWTGLSTTAPFTRILLFLLGIAVITSALLLSVAVFLGPLTSPDDRLGELIFVALVIDFCVAGTATSAFVFIQSSGFRLRRIPRPRQFDVRYSATFSVSQLLVVMFVCGAIVTITKIPLAEVKPPLIIGIPILMAPLLGAIVALVWAIMAPGSPWIRLAVALAGVLGAAGLMIVQFGYSWESMVSMLPAVLVFVATLLALRVDGYRLLRQSRLVQWTTIRTHVNASPISVDDLPASGT